MSGITTSTTPSKSSDLSTLSDLKQLKPSKLLRLKSLRRETTRHPLYRAPDGLSVGAALKTGLLHNLRGAPSLERNAIISSEDSEVAMIATYSGHGKHGLRLAELAASLSFRHVRRRIPALSAFLAASPNSFHRDVKAQMSMERIVDGALGVSYMAVEETVWSKSSAVSITLCLLRKGKLIVGACGLPSVMLVSRKNEQPVVELLTAKAMHAHALGTLDSDCSTVSKCSQEDSDEMSHTDLMSQSDLMSPTALDLEARFSFPDGSRDAEEGSTCMDCGDQGVPGVCVLPTVRAFDVSSHHTHIIVSTMRLWPGQDVFAPRHIANVFAATHQAAPLSCVIDLAEALMDAAFGRSGPTHDCSILCARLT